MRILPRGDVIRRLLLHQRTMLTIKSGLAAGLSWLLGSQLPAGMAEYAYYASLGAISVIYPAVYDSYKEATKAVGSILLGVLIAALMQWVAWPNALTVGIVVALGVAVGSLRWLGDQRHWVATAALFVMVFSGDTPQTYITAYISQILIGAFCGVAVNFLLLPPMNLTSLEEGVGRMRQVLVIQLRRMADLLAAEEQPDPAKWGKAFEDLEQDRDQLRADAEEVRRSSIANPRARRWTENRGVLNRRAEALERVAFLLQDVGVVLEEFQGDRYHVLDAELREATAAAFHDLADLLEDPSWEEADRVRDTVQALMDRVDSTTFQEPQGRYLAGLIAVSARRCLDTVIEHLPAAEARQG